MSLLHLEVPGRRVACGRYEPVVSTTLDRSLVTCSRCLASLAKRDRAFQRKARRGLADFAWRARSIVSSMATEAAMAVAEEESGYIFNATTVARANAFRFCAIAREEGRTL